MRSGVEWRGGGWSGAEWSGVEWSGVGGRGEGRRGLGGGGEGWGEVAKRGHDIVGIDQDVMNGKLNVSGFV